ncbi:zinc carboxypeptidase [Manduca sexta]|uniref:zinc carboxypeptidase n=1 Tax=Manduca sexta TaxID=7130 RepID=UPI00188E8506|nr:zinc carboxypeptidase [Manduca sexta]
MLLKFLFLTVLTALVFGEKVRYDNYTLFKVHPESEEHVLFLNDLYELNNGLDFWVPPSEVGNYVSVVVPPEMKKDFKHSLRKRSIYSQLMMDNLQEAFDAQLMSRKKRSASHEMFWTNYQPLDDIIDWFKYLARRHSDIVSIITVGQSYEGRNITGIKISRRPGRLSFVLDGGQIGADWLSPTILTYFVDQLIKGENPEALAASRNFDWHIFPILNPDGHEFTQASVRLWTKNRRPITSSAIGVDLTKNWNSQWGIIGGSFDPAANNYIGQGPFSEEETRSFSRYVEEIGSNLAGYLSFRSFGQRLLIPFAHSTTPMYNYNEMLLIGRRAMGSLSAAYGTQYQVGTSRLISTGATGSSDDYVKHRINPPIAGTFLLRDQGVWGYTLPVNQVLPSCEETFDGLLAIIREARFINVL